MGRKQRKQAWITAILLLVGTLSVFGQKAIKSKIFYHYSAHALRTGNDSVWERTEFYDQAGKLIRVEHSPNFRTYSIVTYEYDELGREILKCDRDTAKNSQRCFWTEYNDRGQKVAWIYGPEKGKEEIRTVYKYEDDRLVRETVIPRRNHTYHDVEYTYDPSGEPTAKVWLKNDSVRQVIDGYSIAPRSGHHRVTHYVNPSYINFIRDYRDAGHTELVQERGMDAEGNLITHRENTWKNNRLVESRYKDYRTGRGMVTSYAYDRQGREIKRGTVPKAIEAKPPLGQMKQTNEERRTEYYDRTDDSWRPHKWFKWSNGGKTREEDHRYSGSHGWAGREVLHFDDNQQLIERWYVRQGSGPRMIRVDSEGRAIVDSSLINRNKEIPYLYLDTTRTWYVRDDRDTLIAEYTSWKFGENRFGDEMPCAGCPPDMGSPGWLSLWHWDWKIDTISTESFEGSPDRTVIHYSTNDTTQVRRVVWHNGEERVSVQDYDTLGRLWVEWNPDSSGRPNRLLTKVIEFEAGDSLVKTVSMAASFHLTPAARYWMKDGKTYRMVELQNGNSKRWFYNNRGLCYRQRYRYSHFEANRWYHYDRSGDKIKEEYFGHGGRLEGVTTWEIRNGGRERLVRTQRPWSPEESRVYFTWY